MPRATLRRRGSRISRNPSPIMFRPITVREIISPGKIISQGAVRTKLRPSLMILPQLGAGGGGPSPRKLNPDSTRIAQAKPKVTWTVRGEIVDQLSTDDLAAAIAELETDDALTLIEALDEPQQREVLEAAPAKDRVQVQEGLQFPEPSAGPLMQHELSAAAASCTVGRTGARARGSLRPGASARPRARPAGAGVAKPALGATSEASPESVAEGAEAAQAEEQEEEDDLVLADPYIDSMLCTSCNDCTTLNNRMFRYNGDKQAEIADASAGTFAGLGQAAENCPPHSTHPGKPRSGDATATPDPIERPGSTA